MKRTQELDAIRENAKKARLAELRSPEYWARLAAEKKEAAAAAAAAPAAATSSADPIETEPKPESRIEPEPK